MKKMFLFSVLFLIPFSIFAQAIGTQAPGFDLNSLEHGQIKLSDFKGKTVYLFFFGYSWPTCIALGPSAESQLHQKYKDQSFQAIGIDVWNGSISQVQNFKQRTNSTYPLCLNGASTQQAYGIPHDYSEVIDQEGTIRYKGSGVAVSQIQNMIESLLTTSGVAETELPTDFTLEQNYPNPFGKGHHFCGNPSTNIAFTIKQAQWISLKIYDQTGRLIKRLLDFDMNLGRNELSWNGKNEFGEFVASGVYFYVLKGKEVSQTRKMTLIYWLSLATKAQRRKG